MRAAPWRQLYGSLNTRRSSGLQRRLGSDEMQRHSASRQRGYNISWTGCRCVSSQIVAAMDKGPERTGCCSMYLLYLPRWALR